MDQFLTGLKSRNDEIRVKTSRKLKRYVTTELQECSTEVYNRFFDELNRCIFELVSSSEVHEKKAGILAIVSLIGLDDGNVNRVSRFANYLRNILPHSDVTVMEMGAKAIGRYAQAESSLTAEYVEFEVHRAIEWLSQDRVELKRHAAVLVLRELATYSPTLFYQSVKPFFENIFAVTRDPKPVIRDKAVLALRACLQLMAGREIREMLNHSYYQHTYDEAMRGIQESSSSSKDRSSSVAREDRIHGSLLILNELVLISRFQDPQLQQEVTDQDDADQNGLPIEKVTDEMYPWQPPVLKDMGTPLPRRTEPVIQTSVGCYNLVETKFADICSCVFRYKTSKSQLIQQTILTIIPRLAAFNPKSFGEMYLKDAMQFLLSSVKKEKEKSASFKAIGLVSLAVKEKIMPYFPDIMNSIRHTLPVNREPSSSKGRPSKILLQTEPAVFPCISLLARSLGNKIKDDMKTLLDPMFTFGLSAGLTVAMETIAKSIPSLATDIQNGLMRMLALILLQQPLRHPGAPKSSNQAMPLAAGAQDVDTGVITLALHTLGSFNFGLHPPTQFVVECSKTFLNLDQKEVRLKAVNTCAALLVPTLQERNILTASYPVLSTASNHIISEVLAQLLTVGIVDPDDEVRLQVLTVLDEKFDAHLAQPENITTLFMALHDENFRIREVALATVGRLSELNPAYVMPSLRKVLIQILTELEYSGFARNKEQSARLLYHLINQAPTLVKPYQEAILKVLIPKLKDATGSTSVLTNILVAVGQLAQVSGPDMCCHADDLFPIIIEMLQDASSVAKRSVALYTLGKLVEYTGYVVEPYQKYPTLLGILLGFLKSESNPAMRKEVIRVLGFLGALDPYKHKMNQFSTATSKGESGAVTEGLDQKKDKVKESQSETLSSLASLEDFYPMVSIAALIHILRDQSLSQHHHMVIQSLAFIFKSLGIKSVPYLSQIMPPFISAIRTCDPAFRDFLLQQLGNIISIIKQHARSYMPDIFAVIRDFWKPNSSLQNTVIELIEKIVVAMGDELKAYFPGLVQPVLRLFQQDQSLQRVSTQKMMKALQMCGANLDNYLHVIVPHIVKTYSTHENPFDLRRVALETIQEFSESLDLSDYSSCIIHGIAKVLDNSNDLRAVAMDTLCCLVMQLGLKYKLFISMINKVLQKHKYFHTKYDNLINIIKNDETFTWEEGQTKGKRQKGNLSDDTAAIEAAVHSSKMHVEVASLIRAWSTSGRISKDDWMEWLRRLGVELLKESPSPALRSCWALAQAYNPLSRELFNAAFVSCWNELKTYNQEDLVANLKLALSVPNIPEITQTLLNLAEFMEHCEESSGRLPLSPALLGECAMNCRAYAKALHYKELEFHKGPNSKILESLISINNKLQQADAAAGVLEYALKEHKADVRVQEEWYESLHDWEQAYKAYEKKQYVRPDDASLTLGRMRCLNALGEWEKLFRLSYDQWSLVDEHIQEQMARMAAASAWGLREWDAMDEYIQKIPIDTVEGAFYRAVHATETEKYETAKQLIDVARDALDTELTALVGESYNRAYSAMVQVQLLSELEEVIQYKLQPERRDIIKEVWWKRLQGIHGNMEDWEKVLRVHALVLQPQEEVKALVRYASISRKSGRQAVSQRTLVNLLGVDPSNLSKDQPPPSNDPLVTYAFLKHLWYSGQKEKAHDQLTRFIWDCLVPMVSSGDSQEAHSELKRLLSKCCCRIGDWQRSLISDPSPTDVEAILKYLKKATDYDKESYKAWHAWAFMNYEALDLHRQQNSTLTVSSPTQTSQSDEMDKLIHYTCAAVNGFFHSISLSTESSLQDTLRLLTLWFDYGHYPEVNQVLVDGLKTVKRNTWLQVIPQLIARIDSPKILVSDLIHDLLIDVGKQHPQALIYPLTVATKSTSSVRNAAANRILNSMSDHSSKLVQQARMVSEELIRVAILWHEQWHVALEEACRLYFAENNVEGMLNVLKPLHLMMEKGPQTLKEISFDHAYGRDLAEANEWCRKFKTTSTVKDLTQAWDLYYHVFKRITKQLPQLTNLELQYVSPKLLNCKDLELAVPGTYDPFTETVCIKAVVPSLQVITSKQRPRKLKIHGSNGKEYMFLLKGHEDLRQDERVMQLFGLVNTLLSANPDTFKRHLRIKRYSVIPLSQNSGLIGWVPHCDTMHALIRDYRDRKKIMLNVEHRLMLQTSADYDHLKLLQKVEVFEHALDNTGGDDLAKVLWLKSPNSEVWFDRRTNYTRSLAVMSMVGYVLGLGDRHPSNLMLDRERGHVVHIDFGDCFEVAMTREKFPEKIPFRLTRMLTNAMEVTGIEGSFRVTCNTVMKVLRQNKDSLMAVLEAFVYDPLLNWRLVDDTSKSKKAKQFGSSESDSFDRGDEPGDSLREGEPKPEELNKKAVFIIQRVRDKLTGNDFPHEKCVDVERQVQLLIAQATSHKNLCQCYIGWCPFW